MYWGAVKCYICENCDYSFNGLKATVPVILELVEIESIRRFTNKSFHYIDAYRLGLVGIEAERQVKQYKLHRRIPAN